MPTTAPAPTHVAPTAATVAAAAHGVSHLVDLAEMAPFGLEVTARTEGTDPRDLPVALLERWALDHRLLVLRGFAPLPGDDLPTFCRRLGQPQVFEFGIVDELRARADSKNFLFSTSAVPCHFDGLFLDLVPSWQFFSCEQAPEASDGGETLFCDTTRMLASAPAELRRRWEDVSVTYGTEKLTYYGGTVSWPLLGQHPVTGETTIRYGEPIVTELNPVWVEVDGWPGDQVEFVDDMARRLRDPEACVAHVWRAGDIVIADNHALLHGRNAYRVAADRHLRRVNIISTSAQAVERPRTAGWPGRPVRRRTTCGFPDGTVP